MNFIRVYSVADKSTAELRYNALGYDEFSVITHRNVRFRVIHYHFGSAKYVMGRER